MQKTHKLIGVHIFGADACNLIHIGQAIMVKGGYVQDLVNMIYNYPTLAEGYKIAALTLSIKFLSMELSNLLL